MADWELMMGEGRPFGRYRRRPCWSFVTGIIDEIFRSMRNTTGLIWNALGSESVAHWWLFHVAPLPISTRIPLWLCVCLSLFVVVVAVATLCVWVILAFVLLVTSPWRLDRARRARLAIGMFVWLSLNCWILLFFRPNLLLPPLYVFILALDGLDRLLTRYREVGRLNPPTATCSTDLPPPTKIHWRGQVLVISGPVSLIPARQPDGLLQSSSQPSNPLVALDRPTVCPNCILLDVQQHELLVLVTRLVFVIVFPVASLSLYPIRLLLPASTATTYDLVSITSLLFYSEYVLTKEHRVDSIGFDWLFVCRKEALQHLCHRKAVCTFIDRYFFCVC